MSGEKVLITGGLGNVGLWLTNALVEAGYKVWVLARQSKQLPIEQNIALLEADISDLNACLVVLKNQKFDYVVHLASINETFLENYPEKALQINTKGTRNLLQALANTHLPKNFIYFSTFHVYGNQQGLINEQTPVLPRHDYATTHYFAEKYVEQFHQTHALPYTILRLTNGYGAPKDYHSSKWYLILNDLAKTAYEQQKIVLRSNGKALRDFIWLGDVCEVVKQLLAKENAPNQVFNLSSGKALPLLSIAEEVQQAYKEYFGQNIEISINKNDVTQPTKLEVSCNLLQQVVTYQPHNKIKEEALAVFNLLAQQS